VEAAEAVESGADADAGGDTCGTAPEVAGPPLAALPAAATTVGDGEAAAAGTGAGVGRRANTPAATISTVMMPRNGRTRRQRGETVMSRGPSSPVGRRADGLGVAIE
jgi:hypothetical protein